MHTRSHVLETIIYFYIMNYIKDTNKVRKIINRKVFQPILVVKFIKELNMHRWWHLFITKIFKLSSKIFNEWLFHYFCKTQPVDSVLLQPVWLLFNLVSTQRVQFDQVGAKWVPVCYCELRHCTRHRWVLSGWP